MKTEDDTYSDFQVVDDGFRDVSKDDKRRLSIAEIDAEPGEMVEPSSDNVALDRVGVLIVPLGAQIDKELALNVVEVTDLADVGFSIKSLEAPVSMAFKEIKVLREFVRRHGLFGVRIAHLRNIPDVVRDRLYDQSVWDIEAVDYPILLERVRSVTEADAAKRRKDEVTKRMSLREKRRVTEEFADGPRVQASSQTDDLDEEQFEG